MKAPRRRAVLYDRDDLDDMAAGHVAWSMAGIGDCRPEPTRKPCPRLCRASSDCVECRGAGRVPK